MAEQSKTDGPPWEHVVITSDGEKLRLFVNGEEREIPPEGPWSIEAWRPE